MEKVAIIGGGVTGLSAADELIKAGWPVVIFEREPALGGLAGSFKINGSWLEKFYHHIFTTDQAVVDLMNRLGLGRELEWRPTTTSYYLNRIYHLSKPSDLLRFSALSLADRFRLGWLYLAARRVKDWRALERISAKQWLIEVAGRRVYQQVWEPLLRGKFGQEADKVAAVWIWNKLKLRGSSRGKGQEERLGYLKGGFGRVITAWEKDLRSKGVMVKTGSPVTEISAKAGKVTGLSVSGERYEFGTVLATVAPSILSELVPALPQKYVSRLREIKYLANVCLVMSLDRSLSESYWLNVGDPTIPFTGVIEHTNMQGRDNYGGKVLVYLTKYLDFRDPIYQKDPGRLLDYYLPHLQKMFKSFSRSWVKELWVWRERYTQPVIGLRYSAIKPGLTTPIRNLWMCSMANVYPEDRGMNYALLYGRKVAQEIIAHG